MVIFQNSNFTAIILLILIVCSIHQSLSTPNDHSEEYANDAEKGINRNKGEANLDVTPTPPDLRWPGSQLNVLLDERSFNETERSMLNSLLDQIEFKTCIRINRMSLSKVNPFDPNQHLYLNDAERNYIYIFKSQFGIHNRQPSIGLSTFGCVRQGRQSVVLTDLAFRWPRQVLRYHILRSLGLTGLQKPDKQIDRLLKELPLSQKINNNEGSVSTDQASNFDPAPHLLAYASRDHQLTKAATVPTTKRDYFYLDAQDLFLLKQLYGCPDYQNKLSPRPLTPPHHSNEKASAAGLDESIDQRLDLKLDRLNRAEESMRQVIKAAGDSSKVNDSLVDDAAKSIVEYLLADDDGDLERGGESLTLPVETTTTPIELPQFNNELEGSEPCKPLDACPIEPQRQRRQSEERPMILKLDPYSADDPQLKQANQMKLSQMNNDTLASYRFLDAPPSTASAPNRNELMISFEQQGNVFPSLGRPDRAQVLKLCSCTCQTMVPATDYKPSPALVPATDQPRTLPADQGSTTPILPKTPPYSTVTPLIIPTFPPLVTSSELPTSPNWETTFSPTMVPPTWPAISPSEEGTSPASMTTNTTNSSTMTMPASSEFTTETSTNPLTLPPIPTQPFVVTPPQTTFSSEGSSKPTMESITANTSGDNSCDQVQWVKPSKSVYASAKIVWDMDRANQNYFICQNRLNKELLPGKTHGFSCKVSQQGKAYELHQFKVLTKPENVNLAWIQKSSDSFGKTNLPVVGGYSASGDPYIVGRCMVKDENNDVITLIGYVNTSGSGWFPFDDIQIECEKYDILACIT